MKRNPEQDPQRWGQEGATIFLKCAKVWMESVLEKKAIRECKMGHFEGYLATCVNNLKMFNVS